MFRKFFSVVIASAMFSMSAFASTQDGIRAAFDEYTYAMEVEWDQQDQEFVKNAKAQFSRALVASGATAQDVVEFTKSQIKDAKVAADLDKTIAAMDSKTMSLEEAQNFMAKSMKNSHAQGASWAGAGVWTWVIIILVVLILLNGGLLAASQA